MFCLFCVDTDYISTEEEQKVEQMRTFLTEEFKQAAASTAVSTASHTGSVNYNQPLHRTMTTVKICHLRTAIWCLLPHEPLKLSGQLTQILTKVTFDFLQDK